MFVKICGTTSEEDALLAIAMGADAIGFIFAASPRQISPGRVADIVKRLPPEVLTVGVFRDETPQRILDIVMQTGVRGVQLHGHESVDTVSNLKTKLPLFVIKAFAAASPSLCTARQYRADAVMIDAPSPGSGQVFDWRLADGVPDGERVILAGGLNPSNVADAIEAVRPWGVDVATGVEASPGVKDPARLREFIASARSAHREKVAAAEGIYDWQDEDWRDI